MSSDMRRRRRANRGKHCTTVIDQLERRVLLTTLYWDPQGAAGPGGNGAWDSVTANWSTSPTGSTKRQGWINGATAVFPGTPGTIMLARDISAAGIKCVVSGYTITGNHVLSVSGMSTFGGDLTFQQTQIAIVRGATLNWTAGNLAFTQGASLANQGTINILGKGGIAFDPDGAGFKNTGSVTWNIRAQLVGDGVADDAPALQNLIDLANTFGIKRITLPAGTFRLAEPVHLYGQNIIFSGQGDATQLVVDHHYNGLPGTDSVGLRVSPNLDSNFFMVSQAVTGNEIVLTGVTSSIAAGDTLFLNNGRHGVDQLNTQMGGDPQEFNELAPCEIVHVKSVSTVAGHTVLLLTTNVLGDGDYQNISPSGTYNENYVNVREVLNPADHLTVQNLSMSFSDMAADTSIYAGYTTNLTIQNFKTLNVPNEGNGSIWIVGSAFATVTHASLPFASISLNSTRFSTITQNNIAQVELEEAASDNVITNNTFYNDNSFAVRVSDVACIRDQILHNTMNEGAPNTGSIAIAAATDVTVAFNVIKKLTPTGSGAIIWLSVVDGGSIHNNTAAVFGLYTAATSSFFDTVSVFKNSWQ